MNNNQYYHFTILRDLIRKNIKNNYFQVWNTELHTEDNRLVYHIIIKGPYNLGLEYCAFDEDLCRYVCLLQFALLFPDFTFTQHRRRRSRRFYLKCLIDVLDIQEEERAALYERLGWGEPIDFIVNSIRELIASRVNEWDANPEFDSPWDKR